MADELKPCPFCGSIGDHTAECYFSVLADFRAASPADCSLAPAVIAAWNRRASLEQPSAQPRESAPLPRESSGLSRESGAESELSESDVVMLVGHAAVLRGQGESEMPRFFIGLASRVADATGNRALAARTLEVAATHGITPSDAGKEQR